QAISVAQLDARKPTPAIFPSATSMLNRAALLSASVHRVPSIGSGAARLRRNPRSNNSLTVRRRVSLQQASRQAAVIASAPPQQVFFQPAGRGKDRQHHDQDQEDQREHQRGVVGALRE